MRDRTVGKCLDPIQFPTISLPGNNPRQVLLLSWLPWDDGSESKQEVLF